MHVIVVGCGRVGSGLAVELEAQGHSVAIIDKNERAFRRIPPEFSGQKLVGLGFDRDTLHSAGVERADAFASVTSGDNSNILSARIARETYQIVSVVARIYDPRRAEIYQRLGISTVATVAWTTDQIMRRLAPGLASSWTDPSGTLSLVERSIPERWAGQRLGSLSDAPRFQLVSISRGGVAHIASPDAIGQEGDVLHLLVRADAIADLEGRLAANP